MKTDSSSSGILLEIAGFVKPNDIFLLQTVIKVWH
jgi:hypothetical protein